MFRTVTSARLQLAPAKRLIAPHRFYSATRPSFKSTADASSAPPDPNALIVTEYLESPSDKGIAVLTLNRPQAKNAISREFLSQFSSSLNRIRFGGADKDVRAVILRSSVDGVFCAGADLKERIHMSPAEVTEFLSSLRRTFSDLESLPVPTIAVLDGAALGGGLEMALCCDLRVAGKGAKLGLPETKLAIIPGAGGTQRLPRLIGVPRAKELIYTGEVLKPAKALALGLVNRISEEGSALPLAFDLARSIVPQGPVAVRMAKTAIDRGMQLEKDSGLEVEQLCYAQVIPTADRMEGLRAFKEKRPPVYHGK
ncbi:ClpP/crotonase [Ramicandelaber brevisporus]|nr:ClpP/crotonase [Ramicandelaber brevisporus]